MLQGTKCLPFHIPSRHLSHVSPQHTLCPVTPAQPLSNGATIWPRWGAGPSATTHPEMKGLGGGVSQEAISDPRYRRYSRSYTDGTVVGRRYRVWGWGAVVLGRVRTFIMLERSGLWRRCSRYNGEVLLYVRVWCRFLRYGGVVLAVVEWC